MISIVISCSAMYGCGKRTVNTEADEIILYSWDYIGEEEITGQLSFNENKAALVVENGDERCKVEGLCIFGNESFVIVDKTLKQEFLFNYRLSGKYLETEYNGNKIQFRKCETDTDSF